MARFGFIGGSYESQSPYADLETTINWYPEVMESQGAKSAMTLYPTPGLSLFSSFDSGLNHRVKASVTVNGRAFAITDDNTGAGGLYEILSGGTSSLRGTVVADATEEVFIVSGNFYIFMTSGGKAYALKLADNTFTDVTASLAQPNPRRVFFVDG